MPRDGVGRWPLEMSAGQENVLSFSDGPGGSGEDICRGLNVSPKIHVLKA